MPVEQVDEPNVPAVLDRELRDLLSTCFQKPGDEVFREHRYFREMPHYRWVIRDGGRLVAHLAVHDKVIGTTAGDLRIGGLADVCVRPDYRGRGFVRQLVAASDTFLRSHAVPFGMLFGDAGVYRSSGYVCISNPIRHQVPTTGEWRTDPADHTMVKCLTKTPWPTGVIDLRGPIF